MLSDPFLEEGRPEGDLGLGGEGLVCDKELVVLADACQEDVVLGGVDDSLLRAYARLRTLARFHVPSYQLLLRLPPHKRRSKPARSVLPQITVFVNEVQYLLRWALVLWEGERWVFDS